MSYTDQLLGTIDARIAEANEQIDSLEGALEALLTEGEVTASAGAVAVAQAPAAEVEREPQTEPATAAESKRASARAAGRTTGRAASAKRAIRARKTRKLDADGLTAILEDAGAGLSAAAIAERAGAAYNQVLELLRERE